MQKWLDEKDKLNFKIYDVTTWLTNNYNSHIAQYLTKERQPDNEIWSVNTEIFFFKNHPKNVVGRRAPHLFLTFKKALFGIRASGLQLDLSTWHMIKTNCIKLLYYKIDQRYAQFWFFWKRTWKIVSPLHFDYNQISLSIWHTVKSTVHISTQNTAQSPGQFG